jgi:hypothetical protein
MAHNLYVRPWPESFCGINSIVNVIPNPVTRSFFYFYNLGDVVDVGTRQQHEPGATKRK